MSISQEKLEGFQERMSTWVAKQGLMFQLRHAGGVKGAKSSVLMWFVQMGLRLGVLALVCFAGLWLYLAKRVDFSGFRVGLTENLTSAMRADKVQAGGLTRQRGFLEISKLSMTGGEEAFFDEAILRGVRAKMGMLDGTVTPWDAETVSVEELAIDVKAGSESEVTGQKIYANLFAESAKFRFSRLEVGSATIRWGYSELTGGMIEGARVKAARKEGGWHLIITGGLFSQNWLQRLEIERMELAILPAGVEIREAKLRRGNGEVNFTMKVEGAATAPKLIGSGTLVNLPIDPFLIPEVRAYVGGEISGSFKIGGSPYASGGVTVEAEVELAEDDRVELRDRVPLFQAISVVDRFRSYKNVRFTTGRFKLRTGGNVAHITEIWLHAQDVMRLEGEFLARRPTEEEIAESLNLEQRGGLAETVITNEGDAKGGSKSGAPAGLTLRDAAKAAAAKKKEKAERSAADSFILNQGLGRSGLDQLKNAARVRQERAPVLEGVLKIGVNAEAFARTAALAEVYPVEPDTGLRWLEIPLKGDISLAGVLMAEEIYTRSRDDQ